MLPVSNLTGRLHVYPASAGRTTWNRRNEKLEIQDCELPGYYSEPTGGIPFLQLLVASC
jgi:hypothetical protein